MPESRQSLSRRSWRCLLGHTHDADPGEDCPHRDREDGSPCGAPVSRFYPLGYALREEEVRADEVQCGDYLPGLGRVQSFTHGGVGRQRRVTLHSEGDDWKVNVHPLHRVVVIRRDG